MNSLAGQLLLDRGPLTGSEFHRTVVLVCLHDDAGAFGLVLNRPTTDRVADVLTDSLPAALADEPLYLGGPVQPQKLSCLVAGGTTGHLVLPGLCLTHSLAGLTDRARFYAGYAGWGPGQLDGELERQAWLTQPARIEHVFDPRPGELWRTILRGLGFQYRLLADSPDDVSRN